LGLLLENGIFFEGIKSVEHKKNIKFEGNFLAIKDRRSETKAWVANWIRDPSSPRCKI